MKKLLCLLLISPVMFSCGDDDSSNEVTTSKSDAQAFCDCVNNPTKECEMEMEALEEEFKKDNDRYEAFAKEAREICPDAEKYIKRMN